MRLYMTIISFSPLLWAMTVGEMIRDGNTCLFYSASQSFKLLDVCNLRIQNIKKRR